MKRGTVEYIEWHRTQQHSLEIPHVYSIAWHWQKNIHALCGLCEGEAQGDAFAR